MKTLTISLMAAFAASALTTFASPIEIKNELLSVSVDIGNSSFSAKDNKSGLVFIQNAKFANEIESAEKFKRLRIENLGEASAIEIKFKNADKGLFMLFQDSPFAMYRAIFENNSGNTKLIAKHSPFAFTPNIPSDIDDLRSISTAGIQNVKGNKGGYMFMGVGNKDTLSGIVCGWITSDKGSGIVSQKSSQSPAPEITPHIDYGDLRLHQNKRIESEILAIGYFDDIRLGLEEYANAVAAYYEIKLPGQPGVYCTWYHARGSDEERVKKNAEFAQDALLPYGLQVMQIDDQWQGKPKDKKNSKNKNAAEDKKFNGPIKNFSNIGEDGSYKSGMKHTAENIRRAGFIPGLWFMPFAGTYDDPFFADKQDMFFKDESGNPYDVFWGGTEIDMTNPKSQEYLRANMKRFSEWGYKYFKIDGLFTGLGVRIRYPNERYIDDNLGQLKRHNHDITAVESFRTGLKIIRETAGPDTFILGCNTAQNARTLGASYGLVDAMRVGPDNGTQWDHWKTKGKIVGTLKAGPIYSGRVYFLNGRVWYNDPDPIYVRAQVPIEQARALASWVCLSGQMNSSSEDYYDLPPERLDIIKRTLPSLPSKNVRPVDFLENEPAQIWMLSEKISDTQHHVIGLYNWDSKIELKINCGTKKLGLKESVTYVAFDFWGNKFIEPFNGNLKQTLPPASCLIIAVREAKTHPQVISTSRHITQGITDLLEENWDAKTKTLSGKSRVIANDPYELRIAIPENFSASIKETALAKAPNGSSINFEQDEKNLRIKILSSETAEISWEAKW